ncbi:MAG: hypothetical protein QXD60_01185 [Nanopusillaceae archaeon]
MLEIETLEELVKTIEYLGNEVQKLNERIEKLSEHIAETYVDGVRYEIIVHHVSMLGNRLSRLESLLESFIEDARAKGVVLRPRVSSEQPDLHGLF